MDKLIKQMLKNQLGIMNSITEIKLSMEKSGIGSRINESARAFMELKIETLDLLEDELVY